MPNFLTASSVLMCPHGGTVQITTSDSRVRAGGDYILRPSDTFSIVGCPFVTPLGSPHPCVKITWQAPANKSKAAGDAPLTKSSVGLCAAADEAPQGTAMIQYAQSRASGT